MAILRLENGTTYTHLDDIAPELAPLNIRLKHWSVGENPEIHQLLAQDTLEDLEKGYVLQSLDHYFLELQRFSGYQSRDLIVLNPDIPNLDALLTKFERPHTHADDEVRYVIDGEGVFGFVRADDSQVELTVQAGEYINVPAGTEHWFYLTPARRLKAVRYFAGTDGWVPRYTNAIIRFRQAAAFSGSR
ncbi:MAG: cupin domain-containing protein [Cyanothece sp. SIO1E1]|nr:cupin domain-containing protein [Cyanothece sp. SIO1E1]